jgi:hypothetical protein
MIISFFEAAAAALAGTVSGCISMYATAPLDTFVTRVALGKNAAVILKTMWLQGLGAIYASTSTGLVKEIIGDGGFWYFYELLKSWAVLRLGTTGHQRLPTSTGFLIQNKAN